MKKTLIAAIALAVLYGCSSQPAKEQPKAGVEERQPTPAQPAQPQAAPRPVTPSAIQVNPLKDPNNILSKRSIYYDFDKDDIKPEFRPIIEAHAKYLASHKGAKMLIQGNCDERGSREYNLALGQRRADGVKRMLVLLGATDSQIEAVSLGEEKPRCEEKTEECYAQNRRSDMLYSGEY